MRCPHGVAERLDKWFELWARMKQDSTVTGFILEQDVLKDVTVTVYGSCSSPTHKKELF